MTTLLDQNKQKRTILVCLNKILVVYSFNIQLDSIKKQKKTKIAKVSAECFPYYSSTLHNLSLFDR